MLNTNEVRIETCTKCHYSCIFCPHSTKFTRKKEIMTYETFCFIVDKVKKELPNITDITISGFGEAFLDNTIIEKIKYARSLNYNIHTLSNGYCLTQPKLDVLNDINISDIRISLHSIYYESYNKLTGGNVHEFNQVLKNIQYIIEKTDIRLVLIFEIIPGINDNQIEVIRKKYDKYAAIEMWKPHNWVDAFQYREGESVRATCKRPWNSPYQIQVDGTVNMCCFDYNGKLLLGNFLKQTMEEIFNDTFFLDLKTHHENGTLDQTGYICKDCDHRKNQNGIVVYNNKFSSDDRVNRPSTNYAKI